MIRNAPGEPRSDIGGLADRPRSVTRKAPRGAGHRWRVGLGGRSVGRLATSWVLALGLAALANAPAWALPGECTIAGPGTDPIDLVPCPQEIELEEEMLPIPGGLLELHFCGDEGLPPAPGMLGRWPHLSSLLIEVINGNGGTEPGIDGVQATTNDAAQGIEVVFEEHLAGSCATEAKNPPTLAMGDEGYTLSIEKNEEGALAKVVIAAQGHQGLFYGGMTLLQLLEEEPGALRPGNVRDFPNLGRRAVSSDELAHFTQSAFGQCGLSLSETGRAHVRRLARLKINQAVPSRAVKVCASPGACDGCPYFQSTSLHLTGRGNWAYYRDGMHALQKELAQNFIEMIPVLDDASTSQDKSDLAGIWINGRKASYRSGTPSLIYNGDFVIDRDGIGGYPGWGGPEGPDGWSMNLQSGQPDQPVGEWQYDPSTARMRLVLEEDTEFGRPFLTQDLSYPGPGTYTLRVRGDGQAIAGALRANLRPMEFDGSATQGAGWVDLWLKADETEQTASQTFTASTPVSMNLRVYPCKPNDNDTQSGVCDLVSDWAEGFALDSVEVFFEPEPPSQPLIGEVVMAPTMPFGGNLVANPSFEQDPGAEDWQMPTANPDFWNVADGAEFARSGERALRMQCQGPAAGVACFVENGFSIKAGQQGAVSISAPGTWLLSFFAKHNFAGEYINITLWPCGRTSADPGVEKPYSLIRLYPGSSNGAWRNYATSIRLQDADFGSGAECSAEDRPYLAIYPQRYFDGEVVFDDFVLRRIDDELVEGRPAEDATNGILEVRTPVVTDEGGNDVTGIVSLGSWDPGRNTSGGPGALGYATGAVPMRLFATSAGPTLDDGQPLQVGAEQYVQQGALQGEGVYCDGVRMAKWIREFIDNDLYPGGTLDFPLPVRNFFIHSDEIRGMNRGRACRVSDTGEEREFDNGNLLARYYRTLAEEILKYDGQVRFVTENDMFSLFNNGGIADYQEAYRGPYGASVCAVENAAQSLPGVGTACDPVVGPAGQEVTRLPEEIEHVSWGYDSRLLNQNVRRVSWFNEAGAGRGKLTYGMPSYVFKDALHYDQWSAIARGDRVMRGLMDYKIEGGGDPLYASQLLAEASWHAPWQMAYFGGFDDDLDGATLKRGEFETDYARTEENPFVLLEDLALDEGSPRCAANFSVKSGTLGGLCALKKKIEVHSPVIEVPSQDSRFRVTFDADLDEGAILDIRPFWRWRENRFTSCGWVRAEDLQSGFHNYQFDFSRCVKRNRTYDAMYLKVRVRKSPNARLDNLSIWRQDPPCFDCPNPKLDQDQDGVVDGEDNCVHIVNGPLVGFDDQADYDQDGYGNACDSDYNQSGEFADSEDLALLDAAILSCTEDPANCFAGPYDITGEGTLTTGAWIGDDFWTIASINTWSRYGEAPVSGWACADPRLDVTAGDQPCTEP